MNERSNADRQTRERLLRALTLAREGCTVAGIGTLSEKLLHRTLKFYIEENEKMHEIPILGSVADIFDGARITEIQTRSFERLVPKLERFLPHYPVRVVLPLVASRLITYIDKETGAAISQRKSPKHDGVNRAACELYKIARFLSVPELCVELYLIDFEDIRTSEGKMAHRKPSEALIERVPIGISEVISLFGRESFRIFLPQGLGDTFTAKELSGLIKLDSRRTHNTISLLLSLGLIERVEMKNRAYIYRKTE